jgi:hypothetical protein
MAVAKDGLDMLPLAGLPFSTSTPRGYLRPMCGGKTPHDKSKTPHDETTWIARVKLNAIFPVSVGTGPAKTRESIHLIEHSQRVF